MRRGYLGLLFVASTLLATSPAIATDCKKAATMVEKLICADTDLLTADQQLNETYREALSVHDDPKKIAEDQRFWIASKRGQCNDDACLKTVYRERLARLKSRLDCTRPEDDFETAACSAHSEADLSQLVVSRLNDWRPYITRVSDLPKDPEQAAQKWDEIVKANVKAPASHCKTFECKRAEAARQLEEVSFPQEIYEKFLAWIKTDGRNSPFLSDRWTLNATEAEPLWKLEDERILYRGALPDWLNSGDPSDFEVPWGQPPFLDHKLTGAEVFNLRRMVAGIEDWSSLQDESIAGVSAATMSSVRFDDGGSAKCSPNPMSNDIWIRTAFPSSNKSDFDGPHFKIIELRSAPVEQKIPTCVFDDPNEDGFFGKGATFKSNIVIGGVQGAPFVRPDGTFWLQFADGGWIRFRRDMTSGDKEIGSRFLILTEDSFQAFASKAQTMTELEAALKQRFSQLHGN